MFIDPIVYNGGAEGRLEKEMRCYALLDGLGLEYRRVDHEHATPSRPASRWKGCWSAKSAKTYF